MIFLKFWPRPGLTNVGLIANSDILIWNTLEGFDYFQRFVYRFWISKLLKSRAVYSLTVHDGFIAFSMFFVPSPASNKLCSSSHSELLALELRQPTLCWPTSPWWHALVRVPQISGLTQGGAGSHIFRTLVALHQFLTVFAVSVSDSSFLFWGFWERERPSSSIQLALIVGKYCTLLLDPKLTM